MATSTTVKHTCDYCHKETNDKRKHRIVTGYVGQGTDQHACTMELSLQGCIPYGSGDTDVCMECQIKFLEEFLYKMKKVSE